MRKIKMREDNGTYSWHYIDVATGMYCGPAPAPKPRVKKPTSPYPGWTLITDWTQSCLNGDVVARPEVNPQTIWDSRFGLSSVSFSRGLSLGYAVRFAGGHPVNRLTTSYRLGPRKRKWFPALVWRSDEALPLFEPRREPVYVPRRYPMNPHYSKPHPFFSR